MSIGSLIKLMSLSLHSVSIWSVGLRFPCSPRCSSIRMHIWRCARGRGSFWNRKKNRALRGSLRAP